MYLKMKKLIKTCHVIETRKKIVQNMKRKAALVKIPI